MGGFFEAVSGGILRKLGSNRGFWVDSLWGNVWQTWTAGGHFSASEGAPQGLNYLGERNGKGLRDSQPFCIA